MSPLPQITALLTLAIKHEKTRSSKVKLVSRLKAGKLKKKMYYKEPTTKTN